MSERTQEDVQQEAVRDDAIYQHWVELSGHDPRQPLTSQEWQDFYQVWSRETEHPLDSEQLNANPFREDMFLQELDPNIPPLSELVKERDLDLDRVYVQAVDVQGRGDDSLQPNREPTLVEPTKEVFFPEPDNDFGR